MTRDQQRKRAVELMKSRKRKNSYTNGGDRKYFFGKPKNIPGDTTTPGFSDCTSSIRAIMREVLGVDIGSNSHAQILNQAAGIIVDETDGYYPNEANLLPGDVLYFKGNKYHTEKVGHAEMFTGPNECWGHGSGTGPNQHNLRDYCRGRATSEKRYYKAIRWIPMEDDGKLMVLLYGATGSYVTYFQTLLISAGYALPKYGADGKFGNETATALTAFQLDKKLAVTGKVDEATWAALLTSPSVQEPEEYEANPYPAPLIDKDHFIAYGAGVGVKNGDTGVKHVQWELIDAGFACGTAGIDGEFGKRTKEAVVLFQRAAFPDDRSEWDGIVGPNTYGKLMEVHGSSWLDKEED